MAHQHPVKDTDLHFVIDPVTRVVKNNSGKIVIMQHDHQSEILTFELPRYIDTHDMSLSNTVRVHYINIGTSSKYTPVSGVYEVNDLQVDATNENLVTCSWTLTNNATQLEGTLNFIIRFSCLTGDTIDYSWSTAIYSGIIVAKTIDSSDYVMTAIPDILEQWKASLKGDPFTYEDFTPEQLEGLRGPAGIIISKTEPTSEDHPVWVNPDGEVSQPDLGITGATAGQVPVVKTVDASGVPTEWEAGDSKPFVVTVTYGGNGTLTADKTHAEIVEAYTKGAQINAKIVNYPGVIVPSILPLYVNNSDTDFIFSGSGVLNGRAMAMTATDTNGSWNVSLTGLVTQGDIPSGGTDTSLGITGASVGQVPVVNSVDENGVPNGWGAGNLTSGGSGGSVIEIASGVDVSAVSSFTYSTDINGNQLKCNRFRIILLAPNLTDKEAAWLEIKVNDVLLNVYNYKNKVWLADVIVHPSYIEYILSSNHVAVTTGSIYAESSANKIESIFLVSASTDNTNSNKTINCKFNYGINDPAWGDGAMLWIWGI